MRLLVVDDDPSVREALELVLDLNGFGVATAADGSEAIRTLAVDRPDAVILDVLMPGLDGLEVCRRLRATGDRTPVLMLTARAEIQSGWRGWRRALTIIWSSRSRARSWSPGFARCSRRTGWEGNEETMRFEDLELDPLAHEARRNGRPLELTRTEFLLLELLMRHPCQVLSRTKIFECVWGYDFGPSSNSLEVYVGYLRRKTEAGGEPRVVHTVRGVGYVFEVILAMSFRRRMVLLAAGAVAAAIVIASVVVYVVTGNELRGQIDASLRQKLTPGLPQAVQIKTVNLSSAELAKLKREGRLPPVALPRIAFGGVAAGNIRSGGQSSAHGGKRTAGKISPRKAVGRVSTGKRSRSKATPRSRRVALPRKRRSRACMCG